jgi:hypothetical protein
MENAMNNCLLRRWSSVFLLLILVTVPGWSTDIFSAGAGGTLIRGNWSASSTWLGGIVPSVGDNVYISDGDTVIVNTNAVVSDLSIGSMSGGSVLRFSDSVASVTLHVNNLTIMPGSELLSQGPIPTILRIIDTIFVSGDFVNDGAKLDLRSNQTGVCNLVFEGSGNSSFKSTGVYDANTNEFNAVTVSKSGAGRVLLSSDIFLGGGSSSTPQTNCYLTLESGKIVTGPYAIICRSTRDEIVVGGNDSSYVIGTIGRGMSSGGSGTRFFPVGDEDAYRPIRIRNYSGTPGGATGHNLRVAVVRANANPTNKPLSGGIDKVATVRYYKLTYDQSPQDPGTQPIMNFDKFFPSYGRQDGVAAGNSDLRVAYMDTLAAEWVGLGQVVTQDTTKYTTPPSYWNADSLAGGMALRTGLSDYIAIARAAGTTENSLDFDATEIQQSLTALPARSSLSQNYPNPFNPATVITYDVRATEARSSGTSDVSLVVYDVLGRRVAVLVNERQTAGTHAITFDGSHLASGVYVYRLTTGSFVQSRTMLLLK